MVEAKAQIRIGVVAGGGVPGAEFLKVAKKLALLNMRRSQSVTTATDHHVTIDPLRVPSPKKRIAN